MVALAGLRTASAAYVSTVMKKSSATVVPRTEPSVTNAEARQMIIDAAMAAGAAAVGIAPAAALDDEAEHEIYNLWLADGRHASLSYMERNEAVRFDPRLLLPDARTVVCVAFAYGPQPRRSALLADYALGEDYHDVLRRRLAPLAESLRALVLDSKTRIVVDTAPMREKWWARRAGLGFVGRNGLLIVPGVGSRVFLAEVLWTGEASADEPCEMSCDACGACAQTCPGRAIDGAGSVDARRCLSYLTIEHRGELPECVDLPGRIYGCDVCQDVCPHNRGVNPPVVQEFLPSEEILALDIERLADMTEDEFKTLFGCSAIRRAGAAGMRRNALRKLRR